MLKESAESAPALTVTHDDVVEASRSPLRESIACTTAAAAAEEHSVMIHVATFGNAMDARARVCICACANACVRIYLHTGFCSSIGSCSSFCVPEKLFSCLISRQPSFALPLTNFGYYNPILFMAVLPLAQESCRRLHIRSTLEKLCDLLLVNSFHFSC